MKLFLKIVGGLFLIVILIVLGLIGYAKIFLPNVDDAPDLKVESTSERVERGKYLAHHVAVCIDCHSARDWSLFSGPPVDGTWGQGGEVFDQKFGFPGSFISRNITPAGIGNWTDGELFRAITSGVSKDGHALFPIMQYLAYGQSDVEDIYSIMAYIRSLAPIEKSNPPSKADFPMNIIINTIPQKPDFITKPPVSEVVAYGKYVANLAACIECHTQQEKGTKVAGMDFAGGFKFEMPGMDVYSRNITPDNETGIGRWSREQFIQRFKAFVDSSYVPQKVGKAQFNTPMPWVMYGGMTDVDLGAIYEYLRTVKAINYSPPDHVIY